MNIFTQFMQEYGTTVLYTILSTLFTALVGYLGLWAKSLYEKHINDKTKVNVVKTCVAAVEQLYKDLHGEDKYNKVVESVYEMLADRGITITEIELKMLIESVLAEFNKVFESKTITDSEETE